MILINNGPGPRYCSAANKTLPPGGSSRDLDLFEKAFKSVLKASNGFSVFLSARDREILSDICKRWAGQVSAMSADRPKRPQYDQRKAASSSVDRVIAARIARKAETDRMIREAAEREARAISESNFLDESGNPVEDKTMNQAVRQNITPERDPDMGDDLSKVLANNLAVMTTASGQPITNQNGVVVGTTVVSHDPAHYQNRRTGLPPGMPDFQSSRNIMGAAGR